MTVKVIALLCDYFVAFCFVYAATCLHVSNKESNQLIDYSSTYKSSSVEHSDTKPIQSKKKISTTVSQLFDFCYCCAII